MTILGELLKEAPAASERRTIPIRPVVRTVAASAETPIHDQIHALVHELFFAGSSGLVRAVGFTPVEDVYETASLCYDAARVLARAGRHDVGLIDASFDTAPLPAQLRIADQARGEDSWALAPGLWLVPRQSWWPEADRREPVTDRNLERLREMMQEFDFSLLCCGPASWMTARIARACDGLVLVLCANKSRRLVTSQIKDRLEKAQIPVLGSVLVGRRFPVPSGLYRNL